MDKSNLNLIFQKKLKSNFGTSLKAIHDAQLKLGIIIPPEYSSILLLSSGLSFEEEYFVSINKTEKFAIFDEFVNLEWLIKERIYDTENPNDLDTEFSNKFLRVSTTHGKNAILIGFKPEVLNQVYIYDYSNAKLRKICDSIFLFIREHLIK